jgi:hypothetical protein
MSIELLARMAAQTLPVDCVDDDQRDDLLVLRSAGLIAALLLRQPAAGEPSGPIVVRVLAITQDGRRLLRRTRAASSAPDLQSVSKPSA